MTTERELRDRIDLLEEIIRQLKEEKKEDVSEQVILQTSLGLPPAEAIFLQILLRTGYASYEQLEAAIYSNRKQQLPKDYGSGIRTIAKRLRQRLPSIKFRSVYGLGYSMGEAERARMRRLIKEKTQ